MCFNHKLSTVMLDMQCYIACAFRLATIIVLLPQAREIRCCLRPCHGRDGRELEQDEAGPQRPMHPLSSAFHLRLMLKGFVNEHQNATRRAN